MHDANKQRTLNVTKKKVIPNQQLRLAKTKQGLHTEREATWMRFGYEKSQQGLENCTGKLCLNNRQP